MARSHERHELEDYVIRIISVNGAEADTVREYRLTNISRGGFRFCAEIDLQLEDRVQVELVFPDGSSSDVLGRICYCDETDTAETAYGFSILKGFYSLDEAVA